MHIFTNIRRIRLIHDQQDRRTNDSADGFLRLSQNPGDFPIGRRNADGTPVEVFSHMEEIRAADLDVPIAVELSVRLRRRGIGVPDKIVTMKDMVEFICQYK